MLKTDLCGEWTLISPDEKKLRGHVPGCVHTDLFSLHELYFDRGADKCAFIEDGDWTYERHFTAEKYPAGAEPVLVFEGLDTYAEIILNGNRLGFTDDMFIKYEFPVDGLLLPGENVLTVKFSSPTRRVAGLPPRPGAFTTERLYTRRMQCTYGWDWVARYVTEGIYRPVRLEYRDWMYVKSTYISARPVLSPFAGAKLSASGCPVRATAQIKVNISFDRVGSGGHFTFRIISPEGICVFSSEFFSAEETYFAETTLPDAELWYPNGYGAHPLYTIEILTDGGERYTESFGIRSAEILELPDEAGGVYEKFSEFLRESTSGRLYDKNKTSRGFIPTVNGVPVFCTGANWVPCEAFPSAETDEKIRLILERAADAGVNMVRVWGGGLFERDFFYSECDRLGILVTQDFLMACGSYPEEDKAFTDHLSQEAEDAAIRLRNHPSLIWWTGDNENAVNGSDNDETYPGRISARRAIAPVLERLDPNRRFLPSSPYGGDKYSGKTVGTTHNTHYLACHILPYIEAGKFSDYRAEYEGLAARFMAEETVMGDVSDRTLFDILPPDKIRDRDSLLYHTKGNPALSRELLDYTEDFAKGLLGDFTDPDDRAFKMRYIGYEWTRVSIETMRRHLGYCYGDIIWMLNDCWQATGGWALIDHSLRAKAGLYAMRNLSGDIVISFGIGSGAPLVISNSRPHGISVRVRVFGISGDMSRAEPIYESVCALPHGTEELRVPGAEKYRTLYAEAEWDGGSTFTYLTAGTPTLRVTDEYTALSRETDGWQELTVTAKKYIHALEVPSSELTPAESGTARLPAASQYAPLLPGESRTFRLPAGADDTVTAYTLANG